MAHSSAAQELGQLLDALAAARRDLAEGLMPRAARITGTSQQLAGVIMQIEKAIRVAESLQGDHECLTPPVQVPRTFDAPAGDAARSSR
jgi:hypothetical protein